MALDDLTIRSAKKGEKDYKLADTGGLFLLVKKNGSKLWRQKYRVHGREKLLSHGAYPDVGLAAARKQRDIAKGTIAAGLDPGAVKRATKRAEGDTFEAWATAWYKNRQQDLAPTYANVIWRRLKGDAIRVLGDRPLSEIGRADVLEMLREVEDRGGITVAKRLRGYCYDIFEFAIHENVTERNPVAELSRKVLRRDPRVKHMTKLPLAQMGPFLASLDKITQPRTERVRYAIELLILTWTRTREMRFANVREFELDGPVALWRIPKDRMKMGREHLVPLSRQAQAVARRLISTADGKGFLLPGRDGKGVVSNVTMLQAIYRLGWKGKATVHGFRGVASTWANDSLGPDGRRLYDSDWVEMQLAHNSGDVRSAYNAAEYLAPRKTMLQDWADKVDALRESVDEFDALLL